MPMRGQTTIRVPFLAVLAGLLASCGTKTKQSFPPPPALANMPPMLQKIDEQAEAIIITVPTADWPRVFAYVRDINDTWQDYKHPTVAPVPIFLRPPGTMLERDLDAAVAGLQRVAATRNALGTMEAADVVGIRAMDLYQYYRPGIPPELRQLQVLEKRIVINAAGNELDGAAHALSRLGTTWQRVRPAVLARGGDRTALILDSNLADQRAALDAGDPEALAARAQIALTLIRELQRLY
jgi:hypothetical protein